MEQGFSLTGKIVFVGKQETMGEKKTPVRRIQLLTNGGEQRARLYDVSDFSLSKWVFGAVVTVPSLVISTYAGKNGLVLNIARFGESVVFGEEVPASGSSGSPPNSKFAGAK